VAVEEDRPAGSGHLQIAEHQGIAVRLEELRGEAATRQHRAQMLGVAPDVLAVGRHVGDGQQFQQLADDDGLMPRDPPGDLLSKVAPGLGPERHRREQDQKAGEQDPTNHGEPPGGTGPISEL
jgi:hypothetical protein